jgi:hypothetical protein
MKRFMPLFAFAMLSLLVVPGVLAQDSEDAVPDDASNEARAMAAAPGATVRLLQLEEAIERNIVIGERIIDRIQESNESFDVSELESILDEMELLKQEVSEVDPEGNTEDVVRQFVDFRHDASELSRTFREIARTAFPAGELNRIRENVTGNVEQALSRIRERIRNAIREHNADRIRTCLQNMGASEEGLLNRIRNGQLNSSGIGEQIRNVFQDMSAEQKRDALTRMSRNATSNAVRIRSALDNAVEQFQERKTERIQERVERINASSARAQAYLQSRLERINQAGGRAL